MQKDATEGLGWLFGEVVRRLRLNFDDGAKPIGLTRAQWRILACLRRNEGLSQTALANIIEVRPITLTRHLERLEKKGWIRRDIDPQDKRTHRVYLGASVKPQMEKMRAVARASREVAFDGFSEAELDTLRHYLTRIKENLSMHEAVS